MESGPSTIQAEGTIQAEDDIEAEGAIQAEGVKIVACCPESLRTRVMQICKEVFGMSTAYVDNFEGDWQLRWQVKVRQTAVHMCKEFKHVKDVKIICIAGGPHGDEEDSSISNLAVAITDDIRTNLEKSVHVSLEWMGEDRFLSWSFELTRNSKRTRDYPLRFRRSESDPPQVTVGFLSGESCRCGVEKARVKTVIVKELKEEAERKLGRKIQHLILETNTLREHWTLAEAGIHPDAILTAVCIADTPSDPDPSNSHAQEDEQKEFKQSGITFSMPQSVYDEFHPRVELVEDWQDLKGILSLQDVLPAGHTVLSPLLRFMPEDVTFPVPIEVKIPVCVGASNAWRSTSSGWEKVEASFGDGFATMALTHFCDSFVSGARSPLMALGFIKQDEPAAKVAVTHAGCPSCAVMLDEYRKEGLSLKAFSSCDAAAELGAYRDDEVLDVQIPGGPPSQIKLRFQRLPRISHKWAIQSADSFSAEINEEFFDFLLTSSPANSSPAQTLRATTAAGSTAYRPSPAPPAVVPPTTARPAARAPRRVQIVQRSPFPFASSGASGSGSPVPAAVPATPEAPEWHLLLSGRFKSDDFFSCEQIMDYMRAVKRRLEGRGIPAFMVEARLSQSFAELTRLGLGRAKGMVAFCTSEYGAYTGVGYETFYELQFAYDEKLPIFPIKICEEWPPAPKDNDQGKWQNKLIFTKGRVYIEDKQMQDAEGMADKIADDIEQLGLFS